MSGSEVRTIWMSFCDPEAPKGQQFKGVCIVDVDASDAAAAKADIDVRFPHHMPGAEWLAAATRKAWTLGCNPGGEVQSVELPADHPTTQAAPRNTLLSEADLRARGLV